jgi:hypothetical protein
VGGKEVVTPARMIGYERERERHAFLYQIRRSKGRYELSKENK